ncbi:hypothetical protein LX88_007723 [Lentzea californiensis]|nr:hypothetical protein [Lentzea californiensis]
MTLPSPSAGPPSRSGVRRSGDHYQDLVTWCAALRVVQPHASFTQLEIEVNGAGNVDDVVLRRPELGDHFTQVKWATTTSLMVDEGFLTSRPRRGKSVLEKLFASYRILRDPSRPPRLELLTNRVLDPQHSLLGKIDGRTDLVVPFARLASHESAAGVQLAAWADHVAAKREELLEMLDHLVFRTGFTVGGERDRAQVLMLAAGLRHDEAALETGIAAAAGWVRAGRRVLTADEIRQEIAALALQRGRRSAILLVQAIDRDPHPEDATEVLDWVDCHRGVSPMSRAEPISQIQWTDMASELERAVGRLRDDGVRDVLVRGAMRQATFFLVGAKLAHVTGRTVSYLQQRDLWASNAPFVPVPALDLRRTEIGPGRTLAVAVGIAVDPMRAVVDYIRDRSIDAAGLITLTPAGGAHDQAIGSAGEAVAYAQAIRNTVRLELEQQPADRIHLFLAGPGGLALLLGHRWNRLAPTTVYEHLGPGRGYTPAFYVDA